LVENEIRIDIMGRFKKEAIIMIVSSIGILIVGLLAALLIPFVLKIIRFFQEAIKWKT